MQGVGGWPPLPAADACFDQFRERPDGEAELLQVRGSLLRRDQRLLIAAEAVVQDGGSVLHEGEPHALTAPCELVAGHADQLGRLADPAPQSRQSQGAVGWQAAPGRRRDRGDLRDQRRRLGEFTGEEMKPDPGAEGHRQDGQGPGLTGQADVTGAEHLPALVVPQVMGGVGGEPQPADRFRRGQLLGAERAHRSLQGRCAHGVALGDHQRQTVEEEIRWAA